MSKPITPNPYDPRNPDPQFMVRTKSCIPFHDKLRETWVLLSIMTPDGKAYFVIEGMCDWPSTYEELQEHERYYYEEHTCPTNFIRGVEFIQINGDQDPHGVFKFEEAIWKIGGCGSEEYLTSCFPQLKEGAE